MLNRSANRVVRNWVMDSRQWSSYQPREGDVVIATAPKVGTTWMQQILSLLIFQSPEPRRLIEVSPWLDARGMMPLDMMLASIESQRHRRFIKSHLPLDALPIYDEVKYIHVAREGRDACMSLLNHLNSFRPEMMARADAIGLADETIGRPMPRHPAETRAFFQWWMSGEDGAGANADAFFELERTFWSERRRANLLLVHYNDLKSDLSGEMRRISEFLGIPINEQLWPALVDAATFETMKRNGAQILAGIEMAFEGGHQSFLHQGTNERWRGVLTNADLELYEKRAHAELSPGLFQWLRGGRLVEGDPVTMPD